jgi:hypothetical protein
MDLKEKGRSLDVTDPGQGPVAGSCEHVNESEASGCHGGEYKDGSILGHHPDDGSSKHL